MDDINSTNQQKFFFFFKFVNILFLEPKRRWWFIRRTDWGGLLLDEGVRKEYSAFGPMYKSFANKSRFIPNAKKGSRVGDVVDVSVLLLKTICYQDDAHFIWINQDTKSRIPEEKRQSPRGEMHLRYHFYSIQSNCPQPPQSVLLFSQVKPIMPFLSPRGRLWPYDSL